MPLSYFFKKEKEKKKEPRPCEVLIHLLHFLSLGCKAIFLLGGKSREDPPLAMFLRSGDIVLMAGDARECFHGKGKLSASRLFVWSICG